MSPIVIVNVRGFYDPLRELLDRAVAERFMDVRHRAMWTFVDRPEDALAAIRAAPDGPRTPAPSPARERGRRG